MHEQKSSSQLKGMAKTLLMGRYALPLGAALVTGLIWGILAAVLNWAFPIRLFPGLVLNTVATFIVSLLMCVLNAGFCHLILNLTRGKETGLSDLLYGFSHEPDRIILLALFLVALSLGCMLPCVLLFAVGFGYGVFSLQVLGVFALLIGLAAYVWLLLSYPLVYYIYLDHPDASVWEILQRSKALMAGNRGRYFYLQVSFVGLSLLSVLSCGIGFLWVLPYMQTANALFYRNLIGEI